MLFRSAFLDQLRDQLDLEKSVIENVAGDGDTVTVDGARRHIVGYLRDFLFSSERARTPAWVLSGGERNRLLLAKLFTRPCNVLVLDEPTNDLDLETLELLEDRLASFGGTVLLVSHDRAFLDNVVTSTLVFEGDGLVRDYAGGYSDWLVQRPPEAAGAGAAEPKRAQRRGGRRAVASERPRKIKYAEQIELDALPARLEELEAELGAVQEALGDPELYRSDPERVARLTAKLARLEAEVAAAYERWEELERLASRSRRRTDRVY